jgi:hypothetical protein
LLSGLTRLPYWGGLHEEVGEVSYSEATVVTKRLLSLPRLVRGRLGPGFVLRFDLNRMPGGFDVRYTNSNKFLDFWPFEVEPRPLGAAAREKHAEPVAPRGHDATRTSQNLTSR